MLEAGAKAPDFTMPDQDGEQVRLSDFHGKWLVMWWYTIASTGG